MDVTFWQLSDMFKIHDEREGKMVNNLCHHFE